MRVAVVNRPTPQLQQSLVPANFDLDYYTDNIVPQPGPQTAAHACSADIMVYGGAAGGGKSRFLVAEPTRHVNNPRFRGVLFRESYPQIMGSEGLWEESVTVYSHIKGSRPRESSTEWDFDSGANIALRHIGDEAQAMKDWQGLGAAYFGFDELTQFSARLFFYIALSRGRSLSGIKPYVRATCNPDPLSWVKVFLAPWVDEEYKGEDGPARPGEIRHFRMVNDEYVFSKKPVYSTDGMNRLLTKTVTFIPANVYDNKVLLAQNPDYLTNLENLPYVDQERLLRSNWRIAETGNMFRREWFTEVTHEELPRYLELVRFWDLAASELKPKQKEPDHTAGGLEGYDPETDIYYLLDLVLKQDNPGKIRELVQNTAEDDLTTWGKFGNVRIRMEQEPGGSGLTVVDDYKNIHLTAYDFDYKKSTGSKVERAKPLSADAYKGRVRILCAPWNALWYKYSGPFPRKGIKDDPVDAFSGSHTALTELRETPCPVNPAERYAGIR